MTEITVPNPVAPILPPVTFDVGRIVGEQVDAASDAAFAPFSWALWTASMAILRESFLMADRFAIFDVRTHTGPVGKMWPTMLWISVLVALGLFCWQTIVMLARGGRGFARLATGPIQYGIALGITVGFVATFLAGADGLTEGILRTVLDADNFHEAYTTRGFWDSNGDDVNSVVLAVIAIFSFFPAVGYGLEMVFREAAIYVLVATIPITAAGLLSDSTKKWYWTALRWILACILMKPVLALTLATGVSISGSWNGLSGMLAGIAVLTVSVFSPMMLFRLFAFVDPDSDAGAVFREKFSEISSNSGFGKMLGEEASGGGSSGGSSSSSLGAEAQEDAHTIRFDEASSGNADNSASRGGGNSDGTDEPGKSGGVKQGTADPPTPPGGGASSSGGGGAAGSASAAEAGAVIV